MKNIYKYLSFILLFTFFSCDKEVNIISSFDFSIEENHEELNSINFSEKTTFKIIPEKVVTTNIYNFKYEVLLGDGIYKNSDDINITQNEFTPLESLNPEFFFMGTRVGESKIRVTIKDSFDREKTIDLLYNIEHNNYSLEATAPVSIANINEERAIAISLFNIGKDKSVTYERAFYIIQGEGKMLNADSSGEIELDKFEPITEGTFNYNLKFTDFGEAKFVVSTRDSNNQVKNDTLVFNINAIDVAFTATPELNTPFVGNEFNINFGLSESGGSGGQYQLRYIIDKGSVTIKSGGTVLSPGTLYDVSLGDFSWQATGNNVEAVKITFIVRNESNSEVPKEVTFTVIDGSFTLEATPSVNVSNINKAVTINSIISENGPTASPYSLRFTSSGSGFVTYQGNTYTAGQLINDIASLVFNFEYTGLTAGKHVIVFTLENANGVPTTDKVSIAFSASNFNFTGTPEDNSVNLENTININFNIDEIDVGQDFQMRYVIKTGDFTMKDSGSLRSAGVLYTVPSGDFSWLLDPSTTEKIEVTFFVINNNGIEKEIPIKLDVVDNAFDYNIITQSTILTSNESNIEIELTGSATHTYSISYNIIPADGSTIFESGVLLPQNTAITLGSTFLKFNFKEADNYEIEFIIQNSLGTDNIKSTFITVNQTPYTVNITNESTVAVNEKLDFDLSLSGNSNISYTVSYAISGGTGFLTLVDGSALALGSTSFDFTPTSAGNIEIEFTIEDNFGNKNSITKSINVTEPIPVINSVSKFRGVLGFASPQSLADVFPSSRISIPTESGFDNCNRYSQYIIFENVNITSSTPIVEFRFREAGATFVTVPYIDYTTINGIDFIGGSNGTYDLCSEENSDGDVTRTKRTETNLSVKFDTTVIELQVKDSDGQWSNTINVSR